MWRRGIPLKLFKEWSFSHSCLWQPHLLQAFFTLFPVKNLNFVWRTGAPLGRFFPGLNVTPDENLLDVVIFFFFSSALQLMFSMPFSSTPMFLQFTTGKTLPLRSTLTPLRSPRAPLATTSGVLSAPIGRTGVGSGVFCQLFVSVLLYLCLYNTNKSFLFIHGTFSDRD